MESNYTICYHVDICMCIDATNSMGKLLDTVKKNAVTFHRDLLSAMDAKGKHLDKLRVRIVAFRDYIADGEKAMLTTKFFDLPEETRELEQVLASLEPFGGGDDPEDGLEALAYAISSQWTKKGDKRRHIIAVWSDDGTHPLWFGEAASNYPSKMAKDFDELTDWWGCKNYPGKMDQSAKRLLINAPAKEYWSTISDNWDNVVHYESEAGKGLDMLTYQQILSSIVNSI